MHSHHPPWIFPSIFTILIPQPCWTPIRMLNTLETWNKFFTLMWDYPPFYLLTPLHGTLPWLFSDNLSLLYIYYIYKKVRQGHVPPCVVSESFCFTHLYYIQVYACFCHEFRWCNCYDNRLACCRFMVQSWVHISFFLYISDFNFTQKKLGNMQYMWSLARFWVCLCKKIACGAIL